MEKISVVINTYNAAAHLEQVLDSVRAFDEVVICDMESTDDTRDIAARHGCRVVTFPKGNHRICEPARDFTIHSASNRWVLVVDADELVPDTLRTYLYGRIEDTSFAGALAIPRINMFMDRHLGGTPDYQLRFFRQDLVTWPPVIHARPVVDGPVYDIPARRELSLIHLDNPTISQRIDKLNNYTDYEVPKRIHRRYGTLSMLWRPLWFFIKSYLPGRGIAQGRRGIIKSYMAAIYQMVLLAKVTEAQLADRDNNGTTQS